MTIKLGCTFSGTGTTPATGLNVTSLNQGTFQVVISGAGTVVLEFLPPGGATWLAASTSSTGTPNSYVITASTPAAPLAWCEDAAMQWRFNVTAFTSTITAQLLQGGQVVI